MKSDVLYFLSEIFVLKYGNIVKDILLMFLLTMDFTPYETVYTIFGHVYGQNPSHNIFVYTIICLSMLVFAHYPCVLHSSKCNFFACSTCIIMSLMELLCHVRTQDVLRRIFTSVLQLFYFCVLPLQFQLLVYVKNLCNTRILEISFLNLNFI